MNEQNPDIRWKQRFAHYKKAFILLEQTITILKRLISKLHPANLLYGPSYVSLEYALHHYSLIPERTAEITSVTPGRSKNRLKAHTETSGDIDWEY